MLKRVKFILAAAVAVFGSCAFAQDAFAQDSVDLAKAKAEGKVVWYTSTPLPQAQKIVNLFEKEHGIKVEMFRSGGSAILRRFQQEIDAGRIAADVLTTSDPAAAAMLARKGIFRSEGRDVPLRRLSHPAPLPAGDRRRTDRSRRVDHIRSGGGGDAGAQRDIQIGRSRCSAPAAQPSCAASSRRSTPDGSQPTC